MRSVWSTGLGERLSRARKTSLVSRLRNFPYLRFGCLEALTDAFKNLLLASLIPEAKELFQITARLLLEFRLHFIDALGERTAKSFPMPLRPEDFIAGRAETLEASAQLLPWITTCFAW